MWAREKQAEVLMRLNEGDVFEHGALFQFAPTEKLAWKCVGVEDLGVGQTQYTFHVYFMGIMIKAVCAQHDNLNASVSWRAL